MSLWIPYFLVMLIIVVLSLGIPDIEWYEQSGMRVRDWKSYKETFLMITLILMVFCAFRSIQANSIDEYAYRNRFFIFQNYDFATALDKADGEYINSILTWIISKTFHTSQGVFIVFGSLTVLFYMLALKRYSGSFPFAVALLMSMGIINTSFNITQQSLGCAIFVFFCDSIYERKFLKYILVVLCCIYIHNSAIMLLPLYLCGNHKEKDAKIKPYILLGSFVIFYVYSNLSVLAPRLPMLGQYVERAESLSGISTNWITILVNCVPAIIALVTRNRIDSDDKISMVAGNMCLVHACIFLVAILDNYIARLALYTAPFCVIFLSRSIKMFSESSRKIFIWGAVILYSIEVYLRMQGYVYIFNFAF